MSKRRVFGQVQNFLLAALPQEDLQRLLPELEIVRLKPRQLLHKPGEFIDHVYFPGDGFCSIFAVLEDGSMIEAATVEGHRAASSFLGAHARPTVFEPTASRQRRAL